LPPPDKRRRYRGIWGDKRTRRVAEWTLPRCDLNRTASLSIFLCKPSDIIVGFAYTLGKTDESFGSL
jgi:hypothetical protein